MADRSQAVPAAPQFNTRAAGALLLFATFAFLLHPLQPTAGWASALDSFASPSNAGRPYDVGDRYTLPGSTNSIASADFNSDGFVDFVTSGGAVEIWLNDGTGRF